MSGISAKQAQAQFREILRRVTRDKIRVVIAKRGKEVAAILPIEDLEAL